MSPKSKNPIQTKIAAYFRKTGVRGLPLCLRNRKVAFKLSSVEDFQLCVNDSTYPRIIACVRVCAVFRTAETHTLVSLKKALSLTETNGKRIAGAYPRHMLRLCIV